MGDYSTNHTVLIENSIVYGKIITCLGSLKWFHRFLNSYRLALFSINVQSAMFEYYLSVCLKVTFKNMIDCVRFF